MDDEKDMNDVYELCAEIRRKEQFWQKYIFQIVTLAFLAGGVYLTVNNVQAQAEETKAKVEKLEQEASQKELATQQRLTRLETRQDTIISNQEKQNLLLNEILKELKK